MNRFKWDLYFSRFSSCWNMPYISKKTEKQTIIYSNNWYNRTGSWIAENLTILMDQNLLVELLIACQCCSSTITWPYTIWIKIASLLPFNDHQKLVPSANISDSWISYHSWGSVFLERKISSNLFEISFVSSRDWDSSTNPTRFLIIFFLLKIAI